MPRAATSAKFPTQLLTLADVSLFTNREDADQVAALTAVGTTLDVDDASTFAVGMHLASLSEDGFEIVRVTAVDLTLNRLTIARAQDGTVAVAHAAGQQWKAVPVAKGFNQMRDDLVAVETFLGTSSGHIPGAVVFISGAAGLGTDSANFFWDDVNNFLGVGTNTPAFRLDVAGDVRIEGSGKLYFGGTGAADNDVGLQQGAANRLDLLTGDSLNIVLGNLQMAGTTLFESDRDLAVSLLPNADNALNLGSAARSFASLYLKRTSGSVLFAGASGLVTEDNANLFWNDASNRLGIGTNNPGTTVEVAGGVRVVGNADVPVSGGSNAFWAGGYASPVNGRLFIGDGSGWEFRFASRTASTDTDRIRFIDNGSVDLLTGSLRMAGTTLFENDRDLAVSLLPNADNALDVGSAARNFANLYLKRASGSVLFMGASGLVTEDNANLFWDDANNRLGIGTAAPEVFLEVKANDTSTTKLAVINQAGTGDASLSFKLTGVREYTVGIDNSDADSFKISVSGGVGTNDALVVDTSRNVYVAGGDLYLGGTKLFENDRDLAVTLLPNADNTLDLGSAARRFNEAFLVDIKVLNAASDANPLYRMTTTGFSGGAGGASPPDVFWARVTGAANKYLHVGNAAAGSTGIWLDVTTPGIVLKDPSNNYWRVTVDAVGALTTTSLGASLT
jgi:hypothetical protein